MRAAALLLAATAAVVTASQCNDLEDNVFISQFIAESGSSNKGFQIFNPLNVKHDLVGLELWIQNRADGDGNKWLVKPDGSPGAFLWRLPLVQAAPDGMPKRSVITIANPTATHPELLDSTLLWAGANYFNGNDPVGIVCVENEAAPVIIDVVGQQGPDIAPDLGWGVCGVDPATHNHTLVRKPTSSDPSRDWDDLAGTNSNNCGYILYPRGTVSKWSRFDVACPSPFLFISKYAETPSFDKGIEIYNPAERNVDLSLYDVWIETFGNGFPGVAIPLKGVLDVRGTHSISQGAATNTFLADSDTKATQLNFMGGRQAIALACAGTVIDVVGDPTRVDTLWAVGDVPNATQNRILYRKPHVLRGNTFWNESRGCSTPLDQCPETTAQASEWIVSGFEVEIMSLKRGVNDAAVDFWNAHEASCLREWDPSLLPIDTFIASYVENGSPNRALSLFNPTECGNTRGPCTADGRLDMAFLSVRIANQAGSKFTTAGGVKGISATLGAGELFTIAHPNGPPALTDGASLLHPSVNLWNGNDGVALLCAGHVIDALGTESPRPESGYTVNGVADAMTAHTLVRSSSVSTGSTDWATSSSDGSWTVLDAGNYSCFFQRACGVAADEAPPAVTTDAPETVPQQSTVATVDMTNGGDTDPPRSGVTLGPGASAGDQGADAGGPGGGGDDDDGSLITILIVVGAVVVCLVVACLLIMVLSRRQRRASQQAVGMARRSRAGTGAGRSRTATGSSGGRRRKTRTLTHTTDASTEYGMIPGSQAGGATVSTYQSPEVEVGSSGYSALSASALNEQ